MFVIVSGMKNELLELIWNCNFLVDFLFYIFLTFTSIIMFDVLYVCLLSVKLTYKINGPVPGINKNKKAMDKYLCKNYKTSCFPFKVEGIVK